MITRNVVEYALSFRSTSPSRSVSRAPARMRSPTCRGIRPPTRDTSGRNKYREKHSKTSSAAHNTYHSHNLTRGVRSIAVKCSAHLPKKVQMWIEVMDPRCTMTIGEIGTAAARSGTLSVTSPPPLGKKPRCLTDKSKSMPMALTFGLKTRLR